MTTPKAKNVSTIAGSVANSVGIGAWTILIILLSLLAATVLVAYLGWTLGNADVPASGYVAMALGVTASLGIGFGLMGLVFYSSRKGYDEPAVLVVTKETDQDAH